MLMLAVTLLLFIMVWMLVYALTVGGAAAATTVSSNSTTVNILGMLPAVCIWCTLTEVRAYDEPTYGDYNQSQTRNATTKDETLNITGEYLAHVMSRHCMSDICRVWDTTIVRSTRSAGATLVGMFLHAFLCWLQTDTFIPLVIFGSKSCLYGMQIVQHMLVLLITLSYMFASLFILSVLGMAADALKTPMIESMSRWSEGLVIGCYLGGFILPLFFQMVWRLVEKIVAKCFR